MSACCLLPFGDSWWGVVDLLSYDVYHRCSGKRSELEDDRFGCNANVRCADASVVESADTDTDVPGRFLTCRTQCTHMKNAEKRNACKHNIGSIFACWLHVDTVGEGTGMLIKASSDTCRSSAFSERILAIAHRLGSAQRCPYFFFESALAAPRNRFTEFFSGCQCCRCSITDFRISRSLDRANVMSFQSSNGCRIMLLNNDIQEAVVARFATSWHQKSMEA